MRAPAAVQRAASGLRPSPVHQGSRARRGRRRWNIAVAVSAVIVLVGALAVGTGWLLSLHSHVSSYAQPAPVRQVFLRVSSGDVTIVGGSSTAVEVRRTDRYSFGHPARERRSTADGVLQISSECPEIVVGTCSASYELAVPETVSVSVETTGGNVRLEGYRGDAEVRTGSGDVIADAYCGFEFSATSRSGRLHVAAACAPKRLSLNSGSGDAVALVPPGRYRINASGARSHVTGLVRDRQAPFVLDLHSGSGDVTVGGGL